MTSLLTAGTLLGGLGLFILGVGMITNGLKLAGGDALKDLLGKWTSSLGRGVASGFCLTAIVQSSSAVTVATIGFVNAGLISLRQACGIIYGSNVGTTMTGWLVSLIGFGFKVEAFALPFVGIGAILQLTGAGQRRGAFGTALVGFGLFFIGIDVLKDGFDGLTDLVDLNALADGGFAGLLILFVTGFAMTVLTQSSSAAIALIITATVGGILSLHGAVAMVIGANVGTTSTAMLSVIGATTNAKRVAAAHVAFNLITALVAFALLPVVYWSIGEDIILGASAAVSIAVFHTAFNALGVGVMWPLTPWLVGFLETRFRSAEEDLRKPRYLDQAALTVPALALNAVVLELGRVADVTTQFVEKCIRGGAKPLDRETTALKGVVDDLTTSVYDFVTRLQAAPLPEDVADTLPVVIRTTRYFTDISDLAVTSARHRKAAGDITNSALADHYRRFEDSVFDIFNDANVINASFAVELFESRKTALDQLYEALKDALLENAAHQQIAISDANHLLDAASTLHRAAHRSIKSAYRRVSLMRKADPTAWRSEEPQLSDDEGSALQ